jgi:hypothetical protein
MHFNYTLEFVIKKNNNHNKSNLIKVNQDLEILS